MREVDFGRAGEEARKVGIIGSRLRTGSGVAWFWGWMNSRAWVRKKVEVVAGSDGFGIYIFSVIKMM